MGSLVMRCLPQLFEAPAVRVGSSEARQSGLKLARARPGSIPEEHQGEESMRFILEYSYALFSTRMGNCRALKSVFRQHERRPDLRYFGASSSIASAFGSQ